MTAYLEKAFCEPFRDPLWGDIMLTPAFKRLCSAPEFWKLAGIKQLGPAYQVYPGAVHTRLNHSLGVFHLAKRLLSNLLNRDEGFHLDREEIDTFLAAALFHDLGHFPFAHSLKDLPLRSHEELTGEILCQSPLSAMIRKELGIDPELIAMVVDEKMVVPDRDRFRRIPLFRSLLSGTLDPDKLDYLNRDALFCGVPYGHQDVDHILSHLRLPGERQLCIDPAGSAGVENLLFSKYLMYRNVYWHKTVRISTAMIKQAMLLAIEAEKIQPEQLYFLDDQEFFRKMGSVSFKPLQLLEAVQQRRLYKCIIEMDIDAKQKLPADPFLRLSACRRAVEQLSRRLGYQIEDQAFIVDIPEPVSFETELSIAEGSEIIPFSASGTAFSGETIDVFRKQLRKLRIFVPKAIAEDLNTIEKEEIIELLL